MNLSGLAKTTTSFPTRMEKLIGSEDVKQTCELFGSGDIKRLVNSLVLELENKLVTLLAVGL